MRKQRTLRAISGKHTKSTLAGCSFLIVFKNVLRVSC
jgi:hypothetical protein